MTPSPIWDRHRSRIEIGPGCWEWRGERDANGRGRIQVGSRTLPASRALYADSIGRTLDRWELVLHRCGNGGCVRLDHLYLGTQLDNARDRENDGHTSRGQRHAAFCAPRRGSAVANAVLSDAAVAEIRSRYTGLFGQQRQLAAEYGVHPSVISRVVRRQRWTHV